MTEKKNNQQSHDLTSEIRINKDEKAGPLDMAEAEVVVAKTLLNKTSEEGKEAFEQDNCKGKIMVSYDLGIVSIVLPEENLMLSVRTDEMMQVMFASAGAFQKLNSEAPVTAE